MIKKFSLCSLLAFSQPVFAQTFPFDIWHHGKVVVVGWDTLRGLVKYNRQNFLEVMCNGKIDSLPSVKVVSFQIQDQSQKRVRQFFSLPYGETNDKPYFFFELISYGKLTVVSRETVEARTLSQGHVLAPPKINSVLVEKYFLWDRRERIESFRGRRKDWLELFSIHSKEMLDYVNEQKLDFRIKYQLKQIIDFYNSLFNP